MNQISVSSPTIARDGRVMGLTLAALVSFALNSLLCRAALGAGSIDGVSFTSLRLISGALVLGLLASRKALDAPAPVTVTLAARIASALALFFYALPFSLAYLRISAGTGAFVVFGCVQITMIGSDVLSGRGLTWREGLGLGLALSGLGWLTRPGARSPDLVGVGLMAIAGFAWGIYSLRGRKSGPALQATARNFAAAVPFALLASVAARSDAHADWRGAALAIASGAITSGLGYVAWYAALPSLTPTRASILQLSVPPLASVLGVLILGEALSSRLLIAAPLILGGIALAVATPKRAAR